MVAKRPGERASFYLWTAVVLAATVLWRPRRRGRQPARFATRIPDRATAETVAA